MKENLKIEYVDVKTLKENKYNPKQMTQKEEIDLEKSIVEFGVVDPLIVNNAQERRGIIIGGHQRYKIYRKLKFEKVPVIWLNIPDLRKEQELCLRLSKNTGEWDWDLLANINEDLLTNVGFESEELDKIFHFSDKDADEVPEVRKKTDIKQGDLFKLGNHRLMCGDSTKREDMERLMGGSKVKLCFTSPPYNMGGNLYQNYKDNLKSEQYISFNIKAINTIRSILRGFIFWNISYNKNTRWEFIEILHRIITETGLRFMELIIWDKGHGTPVMSKEMLTRSYEPILMAGDQAEIDKDFEIFCIAGTEKKLYFNKKTNRGITNYWRINTTDIQRPEISACYPVTIPTKGILLTTGRGDNLIDPFGGSGSTLIAAERTGRKCFMMEIDPIYCQLIIDRWEKYTEKRAIKI